MSNDSNNKRVGASGLVIHYGLWIILAILLIFLLVRIHNLVVYSGWLVINSSLRPTNWNSGTLASISKCSIFIMVSVWLGLVSFLERHLARSQTVGNLWPQVRKIVLIGGGIYLLTFLILLSLGFTEQPI